MPTDLEPSPQAAWRLRVEASGQAVQQFPLEAGEWLIGSTPDCDVRLDNAPGSDETVKLIVGAHGVRVVWLEGATVTRDVPAQDGTTWSMGRWTFTVRLLEAAAPAAVAAPPGSRGLGRGIGSLAGAGLMLAGSLVAAAAWSGPWQSPHSLPARPMRIPPVPVSPEALVAEFGLADSVSVHRPRDAEELPALGGTLGSDEACVRYVALRERIGSERFIDRVLCLPDAMRHVNEYLAGTGMAARIQGKAIAVAGTPSDQVARQRLEAVTNQLRGLVTVTADEPEGTTAAAIPDATLRQIRMRLVALHPGQPGHALMRDGERVFEGGKIGGDVELERVDGNAITVRQGGRSVEIGL